MKKTILLLAIALTSLTASAAEVLEGIVVRVGDRIVTRTQYDRRLKDAYAEIQRSVRPEQAAAARADARKRLVDDLISELLIRERADRLNITVTDGEVKEALEQMKQQYGITSDEQFEISLRDSGLSRAEMEARLRETMTTRKVFGRELRRSELTDAELRERYNRDKESYRLPERAHLREIVILKPEGDPAKFEEARQRATDLAEAARKPDADFKNIASTMSESGTRDKGGDLGEVAKGDLVPDLDKAVFSAQSGAIIGPLETKSAWHIMLVEQRLPSEVPAFESVKDRFRRDATEETFQRDYDNYIAALRKEAFVQINQEMIPAGD